MAKKKIMIALVLFVAIGAVFVVSQMVLANDSVNKQAKIETTQLDDHDAHHPATQSAPNEAISSKSESGNMQDMMKMMSGMQDMMKDGSMQDMMKMMSGMQDMMKDGSMQDMMKMMSGMQDMMKDDNQMMKQCQEMLQQTDEKE